MNHNTGLRTPASGLPLRHVRWLTTTRGALSHEKAGGTQFATVAGQRAECCFHCSETNRIMVMMRGCALC